MYITHIADEIAKLMNVDKNKLIEKTYNNSIRFYLNFEGSKLNLENFIIISTCRMCKIW